MNILSIESSCDETAVAIVHQGQTILAHEILSQIELHRLYGGVVPELASRQHLEAIQPLLQKALAQAQFTWDDIDALAVTQGPGLSGALLVGVTTAKTLAWLLKKPLIGVNHLEGHIYANFLAFGADIQFPLLVMLVSGGHTQLIEMTAHGEYCLVGETRDDAIGEAFDKVARLLDLPYPGGPEIDRLAQQGNPRAFDFPISLPQDDDFSFSGLKTAVLYTVQALEKEGKPIPVADICASFQRAAIGSLLKKIKRYFKHHPVCGLSITGGVSANSYLRAELNDFAQKRHLQVFMPPLSLCTDNAAMIAACAYYRLQKESFIDTDLTVRPRWPVVKKTQNV
jgi:N6-L-threonylcarbamoyladenine synthase